MVSLCAHSFCLVLNFISFYFNLFSRPSLFFRIFPYVYFFLLSRPAHLHRVCYMFAFVRDLLVNSQSLHIDFDTPSSPFHSSPLRRTSRALAWTPAPNVTYGKSFQKKCEENVLWSSPLTGKK